MDSKQHYWLLAFDIEKSGSTADFDTIAIGSTVLGSNYRVLGSYLGTSYTLEETKFEKRCQNEFWSKNMDILEKLRNDKPISYAQKQKDMIVGFVEFVKSWELAAAERGIKLYKVSDNVAFDVHFLNIMIHEHCDGMLPFPYNFVTQKYGTLWETTSMQKSFLLAVDPTTIQKDWGFKKTLHKLYPSLRKCPVAHDHMPHHDSTGIAYDFIGLMEISAGRHKFIK